MKKKQHDSSLFLYGIIAGGLTLFLLLAPFNNGLYYSVGHLFEKPIFAWLILLSSLCFIAGWLLLIKRADFTGREIWLHGLVALLPLSAAVSHLFSIASYASYQWTLITFGAGSLLVTSHLLTKNKAFASYLQGAMLAAGFAVVAHGFLNIAGLAHYMNAVQLSGPIYNLTLRLSGAFQYANAYAAFLIAVLAGSLYVLVHTQNRLAYSLLSFMLVPTVLSLLLTGSKGGLVLLVISAMALLLFLDVPRQCFALLHLGAAAMVSLLLMDPVARLGVAIGSHPEAGPRYAETLLLVIVPSLLTAALLLLLRSRFFPRLQQKLEAVGSFRYASYVLVGVPIAAGLAGAIGYVIVLAYAPEWIPDYVRDRMSSISSYSERLLFYRDSVRMLADHPLLGIGGGAWGTAVLIYKQYPYISTQAHSLLFQYAAEYGLLGFLCLFGLLGYSFISFFRAMRLSREKGGQPAVVFFLFAATLLLHSLIDFTMNLIYLYWLVFIALGGMLSFASGMSQKQPGSVRRQTAASAMILAALSVLLCVQSVKLVISNNDFLHALDIDETQKKASATLVAIQPALSGSYHNPIFELYRNNVLLQLFKETKNTAYYEQAAGSVAQLKQREPYNRDVLEQEIQLHVSINDLEGAYALALRSLSQYAWDVQLYDHLVSTAYLLGTGLRAQNRLPESDLWWDRAVAHYEEAARKNNAPRYAKSAQISEFVFNSDLMSLDTGIIYYMRGNYAAAEKTLHPRITYYPENDTQKGVIRWYLASLRKQGREDIKLYNQLISIDIKEKDLVEALLKQ